MPREPDEMGGLAPVRLVEDDPVGAFDPDSKFVHREKVKGILKMVAATGWGLGFSVAHIPVVGTIPAISSAVKTGRHIMRLKAILNDQVAYPCTCNGCNRLIEYAITQKEWKLGKKVLSTVPGVGTATAVATKARALQKRASDTLGKYRSTVAVMLWHSAREGCQRAKAVVDELLGEEKVTLALKAATGYEVIFKKLAST